MNRQEVGRAYEVLEAHELDAHDTCSIRRDIGIVRGEPHAEGQGTLRHECSDPAETHDAERLAVEFETLPL